MLNIPLKRSSLVDATRLNVGPNLAGVMTPAALTKIYLWMLQRYIYPQIMSRRPYEIIWKILYDAYRMKVKISDLKLLDAEKRLVEGLIEKAKKAGTQNTTIADTLIFDTVDRLSNLAHFVMWKDTAPVQFAAPHNRQNPLEDTFYSPTADKYKAGNCILDWNIQNQDIYRKSRIASREFYLYGLNYMLSDISYQLEIDGNGELVLKDFGTTFEPISLKMVWVNYLLPISKMDQQPCPFFYEYTSDYAVSNNVYDPLLNPFGFANLQDLEKQQGLMHVSMGEDAWKAAIQERLADFGTSPAEFNESFPKVRSLWTFYPTLPFDPMTGEFETRADGTAIPYKRFVWQHYGTDLFSSRIMPLRLQEASYFKHLPLYGSTHLEDLDSAAYPLSICEALLDYYVQSNICLAQAIENKDLINNPPCWRVIGSPVETKDPNKGGTIMDVLGSNDFGWRTVPDATGTTVNLLEHIRERAQTSSKAVDAILGKAMGGRTTATEASNAFQAAMSGVTTDINIFSSDNMGGYAKRMWDYTTRWFDPDLGKAICGTYGLQITEDDLRLNFSLKTDVGSTFIESIVKQGHLRYALEAGSRSMVLDQAALWKAFAQETKIHEIAKAVIPDGREREISKASEQAISTFLDRQFLIDPTQDHQTAITVKMRYLEDRESAWMKNYGDLPYQGTGVSRAQALAQQIQIHQNFQMMLEMQMAKIELATLQTQQAQMQEQETMKQQVKAKASPATQGQAISASNPASTTR